MLLLNNILCNTVRFITSAWSNSILLLSSLTMKSVVSMASISVVDLCFSSSSKLIPLHCHMHHPSPPLVVALILLSRQISLLNVHPPHLALKHNIISHFHPSIDCHEFGDRNYVESAVFTAQLQVRVNVALSTTMKYARMTPSVLKLYLISILRLVI